MTNQTGTLLLCDCAGSMRIEADRVTGAAGLHCPRVVSGLCGPDAAVAARAMQAGGPVVIACAQEAEAFDALAEDSGGADLTLVDIRDRAGWSDDPAAPKMAALIAEALLPRPAVPGMEVVSEGVCLVIGASGVALPAASRLAPHLAVTCMLGDAGPVELAPDGLDIVTGRVRHASGTLGAFTLEVDAFARLGPQGRGARRFEGHQDGARSACDVIVDLSGGPALFPAPAKRDGYLRADPGDPLAVERVLFAAAQLTGTFEKPLHIRFEPSLCAHARAQQTGCTRCLDLCPTGAIRPDGEAVVIDPAVCAGCGACAAVCPTGAATSDDPPPQSLFDRVRTLARVYREAGGGTPRLLVHDAHGAEMIRLAARHGRGLPGDVLPLEVPSVNVFGHAEHMAALGTGFGAVDVLAGPGAEPAALAREIALAEAIAAGTAGGAAGDAAGRMAGDTAGRMAGDTAGRMAGDTARRTTEATTGATAAGTTGRAAGDPAGGAPRLRLLEMADPDALSDALYGREAAPGPVNPIHPLGGRREVVRLAAAALAETVPETPVPLPEGAPYGAIRIDTQACTLCLACVSLCPPGALGDNPDRPEVNLRESACVQCGLCATVCPEQAITLEPRLDLRPGALAPRPLHGEEPFACIECGTPFGVRSTIERITEKLGGQHPLFTGSDNVRLIQMCDDCRVRAQFHSQSAPFQSAPRPAVRTAEDLDD